MQEPFRYENKKAEWAAARGVTILLKRAPVENHLGTYCL